MTEQEFRTQLDAVVTEGLNKLGAATVYGQLSTMKQFVEVVYDMQIANFLNSQQANAEKTEGVAE